MGGVSTKKKIYKIGIVGILISFTVGFMVGRLTSPSPDIHEIESTVEINETEAIEIEEPRIIENTASYVYISTEPIIEYISLGEFRITAYCSCKKCCGKWADSRPLDKNGNPIVYGASGEVLIPEYSVAVDPDVIPYGTKLYFNGEEYIAHDCGGAIKGNDIDLYFASHDDALEWGVQFYEIFIIP